MMITVWFCTSFVLWIVSSNSYEVPQYVKAVWLSVLLFSLGLLAAVTMSRPAKLVPSLTNLKLGPWFGVGFSIVFGLATLVWRTPVTNGSSSIVDVNQLVPAGVVVAVGLISVVIGYRLAPRMVIAAMDRLDRDLRGRAPTSPSTVAVLVLWMVGLAAIALQIRRGGFGYLSDPTLALKTTGSSSAVIAAMASIGVLATLLAAWRHAKDPTFGTRATLLGVAGSQVVLGLFSAGKEPVIVQMIAIFVGYGAWRRVRILPLILAAGFVVLFVFPFVTQYRDAINERSERLSPGQALASIDYGGLVGAATSTSSTDSARSTSYRLTRIGDVAVILQKTPSTIAFKSPWDLAAGPILGLVPRTAWPGKPVLDAGYQMTSVYYDLPPSVHSSSALTPYGDLWRHGGMPAVMIGMLVLGGFMRAVDARSGDSGDDPRLLFLPMLLLVSLIKQEMDYLAFTAALASILFATTVASRLVTATSTSEPKFEKVSPQF